ncbi:carboxyl-terminal processing protease [Shewanella sp. NFH-SH190041]|uniref:S41 family peptidase n=1 Tax=Shewanella sp. NFH-SH190041 TaxID=2950245 RepID=UPI0021C417FC|nr:S41 family peptidase [Shewanella sp. NFH-SH190041]BDM62666.1 carboxyl-terminal processing protease [Shewanella sp. NFH-SH190041]
MRTIISYFGLILIGLLLGVSLTLSGKEQQTTANYHNFPLLLDVIKTVEHYYVDAIDREQLIGAAIEGVFEQLDPYSAFLNQQDMRSIDNNHRGEYFGFGFEIALEENRIKIVTPFPHSPAERSGIEAGDTLLGFNGQPMEPDDLPQLLEHIRQASQRNQTIDLTLQHSSQPKPFSVTLKPETIKIHSVSSQLLNHNTGYIRLSHFQENSATEIMQQLQQWQSQPLNGLILDLRNNPGGLLEQAVQIADLFLSKGLIVSTAGRVNEANTRYSATREHLLSNLPIIIMINGGSASASEVLAAALQQNQRATLIGQTSFGKGTVQSLIPTLYAGIKVKLTIAKYLTPNGDDIQGKGVTPDILFPSKGVSDEDNMLKIKAKSAESSILQDRMLQAATHWITQQK